MKHPIYTIFAMLSCVYLASANVRGWRLLSQVSPFRWGSNGHGAYHK
jgi:hypothetical protein